VHQVGFYYTDTIPMFLPMRPP